jgi:hypothetical protein
MKKKLITLAKELDFTIESEYFDYCIDSYINGQRSQCRNLFAKMKKEDQKNLLRWLKEYGDNEIYTFYFNLL